MVFYGLDREINDNVALILIYFLISKGFSCLFYYPNIITRYGIKVLYIGVNLKIQKIQMKLKISFDERRNRSQFGYNVNLSFLHISSKHFQTFSLRGFQRILIF